MILIDTAHGRLHNANHVPNFVIVSVKSKCHVLEESVEVTSVSEDGDMTVNQK